MQLCIAQMVEFAIIFLSLPLGGGITPRFSAEGAADWPVSAKHTPTDVSGEWKKFNGSRPCFMAAKWTLFEQKGKTRKWSERCSSFQSSDRKEAGVWKTWVWQITPKLPSSVGYVLKSPHADPASNWKMCEIRLFKFRGTRWGFLSLKN